MTSGSVLRWARGDWMEWNYLSLQASWFKLCKWLAQRHCSSTRCSLVLNQDLLLSFHAHSRRYHQVLQPINESSPRENKRKSHGHDTPATNWRLLTRENVLSTRGRDARDWELRYE